MTIAINGWTLLQDENKLRRNGEDIPLQPLCIKALMLFAENAGQVVSRETLIEKVWNGRVVSEDAINNCIKKIRKALKDNPREPELLETIPKKGYRLLPSQNKYAGEKSSVKAVAYAQKKRFIWLASILFITTSLITIASSLNVSMEVIQITSDMSDTEKQAQYNRIVERTKDGGHMIKFDMSTSADDQKAESIMN